MMDPKRASELAEQIATLDIPGTLRCAARVADVADHLHSLVGNAPGDTTRFETELESLAKGAWWVPGRNLVAHRGNAAWSFWSFTLLPLYASKTAYRDDLGGIVIRPLWRLAADQNAPEMTAKLAATAIENMRGWPTLEATARKELAWIETSFGIKIPESIVAGLVGVVDKQAHLRWGLNRLQLKDRLIPLDGALARELGEWE
jgi:hypothetical protein